MKRDVDVEDALCSRTMLPEKQFTSLTCIVLLLGYAFANISLDVNSKDAVAVTTPGELQNAVRSAVKHIIINTHLDFVSAERDGVINIVPDAAGEHTLSIRV